MYIVQVDSGRVQAGLGEMNRSENVLPKSELKSQCSLKLLGWF